MDVLSSAMYEHRIYGALSEGKRIDGRGLYDYRDMEIEFGVFKNAAGSALVKLGNTHVIAGVTYELMEPYEDSPDEGSFVVSLEFPGIGSPEFFSGPPGEEEIEFARVIDRVLRESHFIDLKALFIKEGLALMTFVDLYVANDDGNILDAGFWAAVAALKDAKLPKIENDEIVQKEYEGKLKLNEIPTMVTYYKIGRHIIVDPTHEENEIVHARLSVGMVGDKLCAFQKGGSGYFELEEIEDIVYNKPRPIEKFLKIFKD